MCSASVFVKKSNIKGNIPPKYNEIRRFWAYAQNRRAIFSFQAPVDAGRLVDDFGKLFACLSAQHAPLPVAA